MAYPVSRSMNQALNEGMTDGVYKKVVADRDGVVDRATWEARSTLADVWHGIHECPVKVLQDGLLAHTPNYTATPQAHLDC